MGLVEPSYLPWLWCCKNDEVDFNDFTSGLSVYLQVMIFQPICFPSLWSQHLLPSPMSENHVCVQLYALLQLNPQSKCLDPIVNIGSGERECRDSAQQ
jgi:hypothetical protein